MHKRGMNKVDLVHKKDTKDREDEEDKEDKRDKRDKRDKEDKEDKVDRRIRRIRSIKVNRKHKNNTREVYGRGQIEYIVQVGSPGCQWIKEVPYRVYGLGE